MTISLDQINAVINVEISDLTFVATGIYTFDTDLFRQTLRDLEDTVENDVYPKTHDHVQPITVGGVALARVIEISPHWTVTFEDGLYRVTLLGSNNNILDVATVNQVSIASTNSAGLTYSKQIEDQSFTDSRVWLDIDTGTAGTIFPLGTPGDPSDNLTDTQLIITTRTLPNRIQLRGALTMTGADNVDGFDILGPAPNLASIALGGASTANAHFQGMMLSGAASGDVAIGFCDIGTMSGFAGLVHDSGLSGTLTLVAGDVSNDYDIANCHGSTSATTPVLDVNSVVAPDISITDYSGAIEVQNFDDAGGTLEINLTAGAVTLDSTCTAGTVVVDGVGVLIDNSGVGCVVDTTGLVQGGQVLQMWQDRGFDADNPMTVDETAGTISVAGTIRTWVGTAIKTLTRTT